jgi:hypothetical protein
MGRSVLARSARSFVAFHQRLLHPTCPVPRHGGGRDRRGEVDGARAGGRAPPLLRCPTRTAAVATVAGPPPLRDGAPVRAGVPGTAGSGVKPGDIHEGLG